MATDFKPNAGVIYGLFKADHCGERFYRPYRGYPGKILAIPGNHDGEAKNAADKPSLSAGAWRRRESSGVERLADGGPDRCRPATPTSL